MANIIKGFLDHLRIDEEDDYDDFLDDSDEREMRSFRQTERTERSEARQESRPSAPVAKPRSEEPEQPKERRSTRMERTASNKIVPIRTTTKGLEVCIMKPTSFEDSQDICDMLLTGRAVVVNLEGFDPTDAQRIMDFISGSVYAINGKLHQISRFIFIFSPDTIDISGDYMGFIADDSFEVPTLDKEF